MASGPVFISGALVSVAAVPGTHLDCLALVTRGLSFPGSHGSVTIRDTMLGSLAPGRCIDSRLKHNPRLSVKKKLLASHEDSNLGAGFRFGVHLEALRGNIGRGASSLHSPSVSLQLTDISQKRAGAFIQSPNFCNCHQETAPDHLALKASQACACSPTELYILVFFKSCCLSIWFPVSLNLHVDWDPPPPWGH